jgi:hypothetical protein
LWGNIYGAIVMFGNSGQRMNLRIMLLFAVSFCSAAAQDLQPRRIGDLVTVQGILSRGGKAGNVWTLTLDHPLQAFDPTNSASEKPVQLHVLRFIGGRDGPQEVEYDKKHVELRGNLVGPFGAHAAAVRVRKIRLLRDAVKSK